MFQFIRSRGSMKYRYIFIILALLFIILIPLFFYKRESFSDGGGGGTKQYYDCIISINIHDNVPFFMKQLDNIKNNVSCNYAVILNCNDYMYNECKNISLPSNVYINDKILNKKRFHGSITEGIYNNILYAIDNFNYSFFIVASSRTLFVPLSLNDLNNLKPHNDHNYDYDSWWWPHFKNTKLAKYYIEKKKKLYNSPHEGLMFTYDGCIKIVDFLENNTEIRDDLFNYDGCVEEFSLQTISINSNEPYYYIGNGIETKNIDKNDNSRFMYKVDKDNYKD